ncbi:hypothetical protein [Nonomuraea sp. NPDC005501]|uniref:hypothetical protein n=1 Tax=Nonomuraea sp. NPDC005501 TaxID=3156884 RepID=UPI0033A5A432
MNDLEETLRRTLAGAADRAPHAPGTLAGTVETRFRRRRNRTRAALAATAVVVLVGGTTFALNGGTTRALPATPPTADLPAPIEKVWPQAVREIPAGLPDGRAFHPYQFIDERTLLVAPDTPAADAVYAYDLDTHDTRKIADVPMPKRTVNYPGGFVAGGGRVVWWAALDNGRGQVWSAPLSGGRAEVVATFPVDDGGFDGLTVVGDRIVVSVESGGVFTVPLGGGTVEPVKGGEDAHLLVWPWIGTPGQPSLDGEPMFGSIRNVETGRTSTAFTRPGEELVQCGREMCTGRPARGAAFVRLRDGSGERPDPCARPMPTGAPGRFCTEAVQGADKELIRVVLHDRKNGRTADLGPQRTMEGVVTIPVLRDDQRLLSYTVGNRMYVVDLTKIP